jgi:hypothetical protein
VKCRRMPIPKRWGAIAIGGASLEGDAVWPVTTGPSLSHPQDQDSPVYDRP